MSQIEEGSASPTKVAVAFGEYRAEHGPARLPRGPASGDVMVTMMKEDGLADLAGGANDAGVTEIVPILDEDWRSGDLHLWVIRTDDVVHAPENCQFGSQRVAGKVKHTNLTGGAAAYAGGEVVFTGASQVVVNGSSGRYRI